MDQIQDKKNQQSMEGLFIWTCVILLGLHIYHFCKDSFDLWGLSGKFTDALMVNIGKTGLFEHWVTSKLLSLLALGVYIWMGSGRADARVRYSRAFIWLGVALAIYFVPPAWIEAVGFEPPRSGSVYVGTTVAGFFLLFFSLGLLKKATYSRGDHFVDNLSGFEQERKRIGTAASIHFETKFEFNGRILNGWVNVVNPTRGLVVMGSPGCGKSYFLIEQAIPQFIGKGASMLVLDYKFPELTKTTYYQFMENRDRYPANARFCCINFKDPSRSNRCNVIDPATLYEQSDAIGIAKTIMLSMNRSWAKKEGDFFVESAISFLAALIWYLRQYQDGLYCTLPHVIELCGLNYDDLFTLLNVEPSTSTLIAPFINSYLHNSMEMLEGQIASARIPLGRLASPELYYVLTGNDCKLTINDPADPIVLCLGGDTSQKEKLAPILSVYIDRLNRLINRPGRRPTALVLDEFASVRAMSVLDTIATGRSNGISTLVAFQDASQLRSLYSEHEADQILNTAGNVICGAVAGQTADWMSKKFLPVVQYRMTVSVNSRDSSMSSSEHDEPAISIPKIAHLSSGEFVGIVGDDPDTRVEYKAFHGTIVRTVPQTPAGIELPIVRTVGKTELENQFMQVKTDIESLLKAERDRIMKTPALAMRIVKKKS